MYKICSKIVLVIIPTVAIGQTEYISNNISYPLELSKVGIKIPESSDAKLLNILHNPKIIYYKLPQAWQHFYPPCKIEHRNTTLNTVHHTTCVPKWGIYAPTYLKDFNANGDFPWETTIGLNVVHKFNPGIHDTINFLLLPQDHDAKIIPILLLTDERPIKWIYPANTVVGEIITVTYQNKKYIQEIRTRTKSSDNTNWFPAVYRPILDRKQFDYLLNLPTPYAIPKKYFNIRNPEEDLVAQLEGTVDRLPEIPDTSVIFLLSRPFQRIDHGGQHWSPMADQDFHILPRNYTFGLIPTVDSESCAACHRQTQTSVRNLIPKEPSITENPEKTGNIRGCDGIFTWHPFSLASIHNAPTPVKTIYYRAYDHNNGIVTPITRKQFSTHPYKLTSYVQQALKWYELPNVRYLHPIQCDLSNCDPFDTDDIIKRAFANQVVMPFSPNKVNSNYEWQYRSDLDPNIYFRNILFDHSIGKVIGLYDVDHNVYRSYDAESKHLSALASISPAPIPANIKR